MSNPTQPRVVVLATSLNPQSRSRLLGQYAHELLRLANVESEWLDLRDFGNLPMAGSPESWSEHAALALLKTKLKPATHLLFAVPIYNYATSAATKNVVELMGAEQLNGKTVGFLCSAGGQRGYMGILQLANSLMLDFRCWIVPRFVYAVRNDVVDGVLVSEEVRERIGQLCREMLERIPPAAV